LGALLHQVAVTDALGSVSLADDVDLEERAGRAPVLVAVSLDDLDDVLDHVVFPHVVLVAAHLDDACCLGSGEVLGRAAGGFLGSQHPLACLLGLLGVESEACCLVDDDL